MLISQIVKGAAEKRAKSWRNRHRVTHCVDRNSPEVTLCGRDVRTRTVVAPENFNVNNPDVCMICVDKHLGIIRLKNETGSHSNVIHCIDWRNRDRTVCGRKKDNLPWMYKDNPEISCKKCIEILDMRKTS
jgi:hypothetical protein